MRIFRLPRETTTAALAIVVTGWLLPLDAQEPAMEPLPDQAPGASTAIPEAPESPLQLIPEAPEPAPPPDSATAHPDEESARSRKEEKPRGPSKTELVLREREEHISMRVARIKAEKDRAVQEAWNQAESAPTDPERRYRLTVYYNRLYDRMLKLDSSLAGPIDKQRHLDLGKLEQRKIRPSVWKPSSE